MLTRKQAIRKLTEVQKKRLIKISAVVVLLAILWLLFAPQMGIISLYRYKKDLQQMVEQKAKLEKENSVLRLEIDRIHNDIDYFEYVAREKHNLLRENEILFDFSKKEKNSQ